MAAASKDVPVVLPPVTSAGGSTLPLPLPLPQPPSGEGGDSPQDRMAKLYQEELSKLMQSQQRARLQGSGDKPGSQPDLPGLPGLFPGLAGGLFQRAQQSDLQRAMDMYQQEFNRLHQNALAAAFKAQQNGGLAASGTGKDADGDKMKPGTPNPNDSPSASPSDLKSPGGPGRQESPLGKGPGSGLFPAGDVDLSLSPLQRMASITNSIVSQPPLPGQPMVQPRPSRANLPPITQQQFDRFSHLNTDEVVRRVSFRSVAVSSCKLYQVHPFHSIAGEGHTVTVLHQPKTVWGVCAGAIPG